MLGVKKQDRCLKHRGRAQRPRGVPANQPRAYNVSREDRRLKTAQRRTYLVHIPCLVKQITGRPREIVDCLKSTLESLSLEKYARFCLFLVYVRLQYYVH